MNSATLATIIGHDCRVIADDSSLVLIDTPFTFDDGDEIPAYAELGSGFVRFFDAGEVVEHFESLGISMEEGEDTKLVSDIAESHGLSFTDNGEFEIRSTQEEVAAAFAHFMAAMFAFVEWEKSRDEAVGVRYRQLGARVT
jgi:hypothetical protein